jgi:hypothetical protein
MAFATGLEGFVQLLPWGRVDTDEGASMDTPRWFQWGYVSRWGEKKPYGWYILIKLPFYSMQQAWYRWDGPPTWHQTCLIYKEKIPSGGSGWEFIEWECDR